MDTKESNPPEEENEGVMSKRVPEDVDAARPHQQPEAQKPATGLHKLLPLIIVIVGILVAGIVMLGVGTSGG